MYVRIGSEQLEWDPATMSFTGFASDLGWKPGCLAKRIVVQSERTRRCAYYRYETVIRSNHWAAQEDDCQVFLYTPEEWSEAANKTVAVRIFND